MAVGSIFGNLGYSQQLSPRRVKKEAVIQSVSVLPAHIEMRRGGMKGAEGMTEISEVLTLKVRAAVEKELARRKVSTIPAAKPPQEQDEASKHALADVQQKFDGIRGLLAKTPKDVAKGKFTLGDSVAEFHPVQPAETLVFLRGAGSVPTKGKVGLGILVAAAAGGGAGAAVMGPNSFSADIAFVDAKTGEVLALTSLRTTGSMVTKTIGNEEKTLAPSVDKNLEKLVTKAMKKVPLIGDKK